MKKTIITIAAALLCLGASAQKTSTLPKAHMPFESPYAFGLDLSFVKQAEDRGRKFYDTDGAEKSPWEIFRNHGYNWGRLMICSEPSPLGQDLEYVKASALKLKEYGYHFALDFMMSDGWSNPMTQPTPKSLQNMTHDQRCKAFHDFVYNAVKQLCDQGTRPESIQIGNEISNGAFWPDGRVFYGDEKRDRSNWKQFTDYIKAGCKAVREIDPSIEIMLHVDFGGDIDFTNTFFTQMENYKVPYDIVAYSFYPWSHGNAMDLRDNLYFTIKKFNKPVVVIETGYYSEPSSYFERKGVAAPCPETLEGQKRWFQIVNEIVMNAPDNMGLGVYWWEPMFRGRGFFDDRTGQVKPIVDAFRDYAFPIERGDGNPRIWDFEGDEKPR